VVAEGKLVHEAIIGEKRRFVALPSYFALLPVVSHPENRESKAKEVVQDLPWLVLTISLEDPGSSP